MSEILNGQPIIGDRFIQRIAGAISDFDTGDFTLDGSVYEFDLSTIVPNNAKRVKLWVEWQTTFISNVFRVFATNCPKFTGAGSLRTSYAGNKIENIFDIEIISDAKVGYQASVYSGAVTRVLMTVLGWW